jgi:hypothetical protein
MQLTKIFAIVLCAAWLTGCATAAAPTAGMLFTDVQGPVNSNEGSATSAQGEACAQNFLGLIAQGDASIEAAKENGGVSDVTTVDHKTKSILGLYAQFCTVVYGE